MSDQGRGSDDRRSKPAQGPGRVSAAPLGHVPLVLAWVREQEAKNGREPEPMRTRDLEPERFELDLPGDEDEFDLPIPGHDHDPSPAHARHVVPPPAAPRGSTRPFEHVQERMSAAPRAQHSAPPRQAAPNTQPSPAFGNPSTQRHSLPNSQPAAAFPNPSTQRHSLPNSRPPAQRQSLAPARGSQAPATSRSLAPPPRQSAAPVDDPRWVFGRALLTGGRKGEALLKLEELYYAQPEHEPCRTALLELYLEMRNRLNIKQHADWVVLRHLQANRATEACDTYRRARTACPEAEWSERTLALLTVAGDKLRDAQVVADATKLLIQAFPASGFLPRALFATANCQLDSGRVDLARATLQHLTVTFPMDAVAALAEKKLRELGG